LVFNESIEENMAKDVFEGEVEILYQIFKVTIFLKEG
jgi:hypothetical protein